MLCRPHRGNRLFPTRVLHARRFPPPGAACFTCSFRNGAELPHRTLFRARGDDGRERPAESAVGSPRLPAVAARGP
jgi:hypothetical protein